MRTVNAFFNSTGIVGFTFQEFEAFLFLDSTISTAVAADFQETPKPAAT
jgi:hypothetical protein